MTKSTQKIASFAFGVVFILAILALALFVSNPTPFQYLVFRVVLSLAAAGTAAMLPGFVEVTISNWIRAGGALAVFLIVFFYNPASLVAPPPPDSKSMAIPAGQTFAQVVELIASSDQMRIEWVSCTDELKHASVAPCSITASDGCRLIEFIGNKISGRTRIKSVSQDKKRGVYEIHCD
jgi:hypothetical protein